MLTFACPLQYSTWQVQCTCIFICISFYLYLYLYLCLYLYLYLYLVSFSGPPQLGLLQSNSRSGGIVWPLFRNQPISGREKGQSTHFWPPRRKKAFVRPTYCPKQASIELWWDAKLDPPRDETEIATSCLGLVWRNWQPSIFPERCFSSAAQSMLVAIKENILNGPDWQ